MTSCTRISLSNRLEVKPIRRIAHLQHGHARVDRIWRARAWLQLQYLTPQQPQLKVGKYVLARALWIQLVQMALLPVRAFVAAPCPVAVTAAAAAAAAVTLAAAAAAPDTAFGTTAAMLE